MCVRGVESQKHSGGKTRDLNNGLKLTFAIIMLAVPWPGLPGLTLCLNFMSTLSRPMRATVPAHSATAKSAHALAMKGAAWSAVRHSSGNCAPAHELDDGMTALMAATRSMVLPGPDAPAGAGADVAAGATVVVVVACLTPLGHADASPQRRRADRYWARIMLIQETADDVIGDFRAEALLGMTKVNLGKEGLDTLVAVGKRTRRQVQPVNRLQVCNCKGQKRKTMNGWR